MEKACLDRVSGMPNAIRVHDSEASTEPASKSSRADDEAAMRSLPRNEVRRAVRSVWDLANKGEMIHQRIEGATWCE